jgi:cytochrome c biogenesis protein CcdA
LTGYFTGLLTSAQTIGRQAGTGNWGGFVMGLVLGIIWTPCAGPVLGSILTLIATQTDLAQASILLVAYAVGAGIPLLVIGYASQWVTTRVSSLARHAKTMQQVFGVLILLLAAAMFYGYDLEIQQKLLELYPQSYFKF